MSVNIPACFSGKSADEIVEVFIKPLVAPGDVYVTYYDVVGGVPTAAALALIMQDFKTLPRSKFLIDTMQPWSEYASTMPHYCVLYRDLNTLQSLAKSEIVSCIVSDVQQQLAVGLMAHRDEHYDVVVVDAPNLGIELVFRDAEECKVVDEFLQLPRYVAPVSKCKQHGAIYVCTRCCDDAPRTETSDCVMREA